MNGELAWLIEELLAAEANGELVHIINHIPPGNADCLGAWGREYAKIIDRLTIVEIEIFFLLVFVFLAQRFSNFCVLA